MEKTHPPKIRPLLEMIASTQRVREALARSAPQGQLDVGKKTKFTCPYFRSEKIMGQSLIFLGNPKEK